MALNITKRDKKPLPAGADSAEYITASDINALVEAVNQNETAASEAATAAADALNAASGALKASDISTDPGDAGQDGKLATQAQVKGTVGSKYEFMATDINNVPNAFLSDPLLPSSEVFLSGGTVTDYVTDRSDRVYRVKPGGTDATVFVQVFEAVIQKSAYPINIGDSFTGAFLVRARNVPSGARVGIRIDSVSSTGAVLNNSGYAYLTNLNDTWQQQTSTPIARAADSTSLRLAIYCRDFTAGSGIEFDFTGFTLTKTELFKGVKDDASRVIARTVKNTVNKGLAGKKLVSYGDSITAANNYQPTIADKTGVISVVRGIGSTTVRETGSIAYVDAQGNYLSRPVEYGGSGAPAGTEGVDYFTIQSSMSNQERINTIPTDADIILAFGGANDGSATGAITDTDVSTFYGAYKTMLDRIHARCPNALIICVTPPHHKTADAPGMTSYEGMRQAIREVAYMYSYPVIDLKAKAQINGNNATQYLADNVHPNVEGGKLIGTVIAAELNVVAR